VANNPKLSTIAANAAADAVTPLLAAGYLRLYDGTQPPTADTAVSTQVLLAELRYGTPAFGAAVNAIATANAITPDASANATGTATWFRALKSDGTTVVFDGSVGTTAADLVLSAVAIAAGTAVSVTAFTYEQARSNP
jgi:hypothetical protein